MVYFTFLAWRPEVPRWQGIGKLRRHRKFRDAISKQEITPHEATPSRAVSEVLMP